VILLRAEALSCPRLLPPGLKAGVSGAVLSVTGFSFFPAFSVNNHQLSEKTEFSLSFRAGIPGNPLPEGFSPFQESYN